MCRAGVEPVGLRGDVVQDLLPAGLGVAGEAGAEDLDEPGVGGPQLLDREVAAEHAPAGAEEVDGGLDDRLPFLLAAAPGEGAEA
jgi:hypothetical protein